MKKSWYLLMFVSCLSFVTPSFGQSSKKEQDATMLFSTFPNPVRQGLFTISTSNANEKQVTIYNVLGKNVFTKTFRKMKKQFDVSQVKPGLYIMKLREGDKVATKKLIIK